MSDKTVDIHDIWTLLSTQRGAWRTPVLSSVSQDGADARVVVLRQVDTAARRLRFYTDLNLPKVGQLSQNARVCWLVYDREQSLQVRLYGEAQQVTEPETIDGCWNTLSAVQQQLYQLDFSDDLKASGRENFVVIDTTVTRLHALLLSANGNKAWEFLWQNNQWKAFDVRP